MKRLDNHRKREDLRDLQGGGTRCVHLTLQCDQILAKDRDRGPTALLIKVGSLYRLYRYANNILYSRRQKQDK
jgi:hypothetical protein